MKTYAHRGFSGEYPENTMLAFKKAFEVGCDGIELDVHLSKDGKLVVIHDEKLDRTTDATGYVKDFTLAELQSINAGSKECFERIPSFEEYCLWVKDLPLETNIEIKTNLHYYADIEEKLIAMLKKYDLMKKCIISSFNHATLWKVKTLAPELRCGCLLNSRGMGNAGTYVETMGMQYYHPDCTTLEEAVVQDCHAHGIGVNVWTINDMASLQAVMKWNVDGIITNYPNIVHHWVQAQKRKG